MISGMISSKDLLREAGISRATLNNYIQMGLLPKPEVKAATANADDGGRGTRLGYFPASAVKTLETVARLKKAGMAITDIAAKLAPDDGSFKGEPHTASVTPLPAPGHAQTPGQPMHLSLDQVTCPAYLVSAMFELEWQNDAAGDLLVGTETVLSGDITERGLFAMLLAQGGVTEQCEGLDELLAFHLRIAKNRIAKHVLLNLDPDLSPEHIERMAQLYDEVEPLEIGETAHTQVNLAPRGEAENWHNLYASFFREGIFFAYAPLEDGANDLLALLARRDIVIRDLLKQRRPYLTPMAVLVADLQNSVKICAELPPEEYFELINQIWTAMEPKLRKYYATHGKHVGDGMVYYFFPQPDCNYLLNAILCAEEMKAEIKIISHAWAKRKNWLNELKLNIGLVEGQEWFGAYQTPTHIEFTVLGDTINTAGRLSDFAREGTVWATKAMLAKLSTKERAAITYGIRRAGADGGEIMVKETYSRVSNLIDLDNPRYDKFNDIAVLAVTEVLDVDRAAGEG